MRVLPGSPQTLGAHWDGEAVNFALFSANAKRVEGCLFDGPGPEVESKRFELPECTGDVWLGRFIEKVQGPPEAYRMFVVDVR